MDDSPITWLKQPLATQTLPLSTTKNKLAYLTCDLLLLC